jgi:F0F1-type ATP synthase assembly protein I
MSASGKNMHEEVTQWHIQPRFPFRLVAAALIGVFAGAALAYMTQDIAVGLIVGLLIALTGFIANKVIVLRDLRKGVQDEDQHP